MMRRAVAAVLVFAAVSAAAPAFAHRIIVFASAQSGEIVVEAKFANGRPVAEGEVVVKGADDAPLFTAPIEADGTLRFPIDPDAHAAGLTIEVQAGDHHEDYWILTPDDIAAGTP